VVTQARRPASDTVIPGLHASAPEPVPFGPSLEIRADLLERERDNLLIYRADTLKRLTPGPCPAAQQSAALASRACILTAVRQRQVRGLSSSAQAGQRVDKLVDLAARV
jgi:hypothetical protein